MPTPVEIYNALIPNGDESIVVASAGVKTLTPPKAGSIKAVISNPVICSARFGATPTATAGTYYAANQGIVLGSEVEISQCQVYVSAATTLFVQYFK